MTAPASREGEGVRPGQEPSGGCDRSTPAADAQPPGGEPAKDRFRLSATPALIASLLALISAAVALLFDLSPSLRPDPRLDLGSDVAVLAVEAGITKDQWLRRTSVTDAEYQRRHRRERLVPGATGAGLRIPGYMAYVRVSMRGFKRRKLAVFWWYYDSKRDRREHAPAWGSEPHRADIRADAPSDSFISEIWLPPIWDRRMHRVRIEVRDPNGVLLALADSRPFRGLG